MTSTALLVRQTLLPDCDDDVAQLVSEHVQTTENDGTKVLLPQPELGTVTLFVERGKHGPALWWYIELSGESTDQWTEPVAAIRESPLFAKGLEDLVSSDSKPRVFGPDRSDSLLIVHARHPNRPTTYDVGAEGMAEPDGKWKPRFILAEEGSAPVPDVVFVRWKLQSGPPTWFMRVFARFTNWLDDEGWLERKFTEWSEPVLQEEDMWTESVFLERGLWEGRDSDRSAVLGVMETAEMKGVEEGFYRTDNLVARASERVLGWIIEDPAQALQYEALRTDFEPVVHAVNSERI